MLSIENPSCSSKDSDLATAHEDHQAHPPNFSIRDYVFKSRRKDIRINWPFREQLLQLCLDKGISDVLPPLQPPSLVRANCLRNEVESEPLPKCSENKALLGNGESKVDDIELRSSLPLDSLAFVSSDQSRHSLPERRVFKVHRDNKLTQIESEINASSVTSHDLSEGISGDQLRKKCRLTVKLCTGREISTPEDLLSNSIAVSDPMASKVCPVCKSFTSTSNTTLNAHIDQCLSSDQSNATRDAAEIPKPRVQPRKKRLMVDIYKTALCCSLEDLDRRNGTNWAASLAPVPPANDINVETERTRFAPSPPENDINLETKRAKFSPSDGVNEGNVGDIYVDSNGTKLLILSKFNESPPLVSRKTIKLKQHGKGFKEDRSCSIPKKKVFEPKHSKFMKDNPQNKKYCVVKGFNSEIEAATEGDHIADAHQENEESMSQLLNAYDPVENSEPSTLGHWVCSKRSDLSRKSDNKDMGKGSEKTAVATRKLSFRCNQPDSAPSSIQRSRALNLPSSSEAMASPKTKGMNILFNTARCMDSGKKIGRQPSNLNSKLLLEGDSLADGRLAKRSSPNQSCHASLMARKRLTSKKSERFISLEGMKVDKSEKFITTKKFKHRSILSCSKWRGGEKNSDIGGGTDGSGEDFNLISSRVNETSKIYQSNFSGNQEKGSLCMTDTMRTVTVTPAYDTNLDPTPEEDEGSISRDETQVELPVQESTYNQDVQCGDATSNEVISQDIQIADEQAEPILRHGEFQTDTSSFQEPNPCFTSDGEMGLENTQENSSTTFVRAEFNQDHNMVVDRESSGSAVSTTSTISPPSPVDDNIEDSEAELLAEGTPVQDKLSSLITRKDNKVKLSPPAKEPSCSCSESLSRESQFANHARKNTPSSLFIQPPILPSFQVCPSLESHTESVLTTDSPKSAMNISTPCSRAQSASNPILRLMGKDLVVSKEESVQLPTFLPCDSNYNSEAKFLSFGIPNNVGFISYNNPYHYQIQATGNHQFPLQPLQRSYMLNSPSQCNMDRMVAPHQYRPVPVIPSNQAREVIVIDNDCHELEADQRTKFTTLPQTVQNPNLMAPQRMFACFPSQNPHVSRAFTNPSQRETSTGPFIFQSPSSLYFSQTLR